MANRDIQMTESGDIAFLSCDLYPTDSVKQQILIKLRWFLNEWRYNPAFGIDYYGSVLVKKPNELKICAMITSEVKSIPDVIRVENCRIAIDAKTRVAKVTFTAYTTKERIDIESDIWDFADYATLIYGQDENGNLTVQTADGIAHGSFSIANGHLQYSRTPNMEDYVYYELDGNLYEMKSNV